MDILKSHALEGYRFSVVQWALVAPHAGKKKLPQPKFPGILKNDD